MSVLNMKYDPMIYSEKASVKIIEFPENKNAGRP